MEFLYSQLRSSTEPSLSQYFVKVPEKKVGILQILDMEPMFQERPRIVFKTKNLNITKTLAKIINVSKDISCNFLMSYYDMPHSSFFCDNSLSKCLKNGTTGFMAPFTYVRKLRECSCVTRKEPVFKVVPRCQLADDFQDGYSKYCFQCFVKLSKKKHIYVFREHMFCSVKCRYEAYLVHLYNEKVMKAILGDCRSEASDHSLSRMDQDNIFTIGYST